MQQRYVNQKQNKGCKQRGNTSDFTWMRCKSVSCSCILVIGLLFIRDGSGFCIGRIRLPELEAGSWFEGGNRPLSFAFGGAGVD